MVLQFVKLWKSVMTSARDLMALGQTGSVGPAIGVGLVLAGLKASSLIMASGTADVPAVSEKALQEVQRTLKDARALIADVSGARARR